MSRHPQFEQGEKTRERILEVYRRQDQPLSLRDVAQQVGLSLTAVKKHVDRLAQDGRLTRQDRGYTAVQQ